jgi:hypothetical protein
MARRRAREVQRAREARARGLGGGRHPGLRVWAAFAPYCLGHNKENMHCTALRRRRAWDARLARVSVRCRGGITYLARRTRAVSTMTRRVLSWCPRDCVWGSCQKLEVAHTPGARTRGGLTHSWPAGLAAPWARKLETPCCHKVYCNEGKLRAFFTFGSWALFFLSIAIPRARGRASVRCARAIDVFSFRVVLLLVPARRQPLSSLPRALAWRMYPSPSAARRVLCRVDGLCTRSYLADAQPSTKILVAGLARLPGMNLKTRVLFKFLLVLN